MVRRAMGPGAAAGSEPAAARPPLCGVRVFDVILRRIEAVTAEADVVWEVWKLEREDMTVLHRYVRLVRRAARLKVAAMEDLDGRAQAFAGSFEGGAR